MGHLAAQAEVGIVTRYTDEEPDVDAAFLAVPRPDRLSEEERALMKRAMVYRDRCAAVEKLMACYRTQSQPSERLHRELARTKKAIDRLALDPEKE